GLAQDRDDENFSVDRGSDLERHGLPPASLREAATAMLRMRRRRGRHWQRLAIIMLASIGQERRHVQAHGSLRQLSCNTLRSDGWCTVIAGARSTRAGVPGKPSRHLAGPERAGG